MSGIIYILTNQAMPGFIKIGKTDGELTTRIRSLNNTSVPFDFECYYAARVDDCANAERLLHDAFADHRPNPRREFFNLEPERARSALMLAALEDVTPGVEEVIPDATERAAVVSMAKRRRTTSLADIGVQPGRILTLDRDESITCEIVDDWQVRFNGQVMSLSAAARDAINSCGYDWPSANGWQHWLVDGRRLRELVNEHLAE